MVGLGCLVGVGCGRSLWGVCGVLLGLIWWCALRVFGGCVVCMGVWCVVVGVCGQYLVVCSASCDLAPITGIYYTPNNPS